MYFNTSNVTIQPSRYVRNYSNKYISIHLMLLFNITCTNSWLCYINFNTSNVTVQLSYYDFYCGGLQISIHLMLLFNRQPNLHYQASLLISIHLMLLFNRQPILHYQASLLISIHLCYYSTYCLSCSLLSCVISIHLMLLFNIITHFYPTFLHIFQYI